MKKIAEIKGVKVYFDNGWDEFIVIGTDGDSYHTDNKEDAMGTANLMANHCTSLVAAWSPGKLNARR